jgi:hypothetical protein
MVPQAKTALFDPPEGFPQPKSISPKQACRRVTGARIASPLRTAQTGFPHAALISSINFHFSFSAFSIYPQGITLSFPVRTTIQQFLVFSDRFFI